MITTFIFRLTRELAKCRARLFTKIGLVGPVQLSIGLEIMKLNQAQNTIDSIIFLVGQAGPSPSEF